MDDKGLEGMTRLHDVGEGLRDMPMGIIVHSRADNLDGFDLGEQGWPQALESALLEQRVEEAAKLGGRLDIDYGCAKMNEAVQGKSSLGIEGLNLDHPDLDRGEKTCMREDKGKDGPGQFLIEIGAVVLRANGGVTAPLKLTN
ncbi:hypothetical protein BGX33_011425 [Mortierella sp. NVP41]|nr:hypothetical protein BGX33_011425 [Mortierella sp. NVP41]